MKIPFNRPPAGEKSEEYLIDVLRSLRYSGDGVYTKKCTEWIVKKVPDDEGYQNIVLMTTSGSHALEMAASLIAGRLISIPGPIGSHRTSRANSCARIFGRSLKWPAK